MKEWVLFSAWTLGLSSLRLFPHTCWPVPWPPGWDGVLYTLREAAGGSHSLPFFSLPLSLSPSPRQTRAIQSRCGHTVGRLKPQTVCSPPSYAGNIYPGETVVRKSMSKFWTVLCSYAEILSSFLACNQEERKTAWGQGMHVDRLWKTLAGLL